MEDGKVLVWGTGKNGSLGLGADLLTIKLPTPISWGFGNARNDRLFWNSRSW